MGNIRYDLNELFGQLRQFIAAKNDQKINMQITPLHLSNGPAIEKINDCIKAYYEYGDNINRLYEATSVYLSKAVLNIRSCEAENTVKNS